MEEGVGWGGRRGRGEGASNVVSMSPKTEYHSREAGGTGCNAARNQVGLHKQVATNLPGPQHLGETALRYRRHWKVRGRPGLPTTGGSACLTNHTCERRCLLIRPKVFDARRDAQ